MIDAAKTIRVDLGDHETAARVTGEGPPVLLIHAVGLDGAMWADVVASLAQQRTLITYDLRGHGSAAGAPGPFSIAGFAADAASVIAAIGPAAVHVAGISLGGAIAQELAIGYPEVVSGLTLCATLSQGSRVALQWAEQSEQDGIEAQLETTLARWFRPAFRESHPHVVAYAAERIGAMRVDDWAATWRALAALDTRGRLHLISAPTQLIVGELDRSTPVAESELIASLIPGASLQVVPDTSHMLALERPHDLAAVVASGR